MKIYDVADYISFGRNIEKGLTVSCPKQMIIPLKEDQYDKEFAKDFLGLDEEIKDDEMLVQDMIKLGLNYGTLSGEATVVRPEFDRVPLGETVHFETRYRDSLLLFDSNGIEIDYVRFAWIEYLDCFLLKPGPSLQERVEKNIEAVFTPELTEDLYYHKRGVMLRAIKLCMANGLSLNIGDRFYNFLIKLRPEYARDWIMTSMDPERLITFEEAVTLLFTGRSVRQGSEIYDGKRIRELKYQELYEVI